MSIPSSNPGNATGGAPPTSGAEAACQYIDELCRHGKAAERSHDQLLELVNTLLGENIELASRVAGQAQEEAQKLEQQQRDSWYATGQFVRYARQLMRYRQEQLAQRCGVTRLQLVMIERGVMPPPAQFGSRFMELCQAELTVPTGVVL